jgi:hypothetical protein
VPGSTTALDDLRRAGVQVHGEPVRSLTLRGYRGADVGRGEGTACRPRRSRSSTSTASHVNGVPFLHGLVLVQRQEGERDRRVVVPGGLQPPRRRSGCSAGSAGWSIGHLPVIAVGHRRTRAVQDRIGDACVQIHSSAAAHGRRRCRDSFCSTWSCWESFNPLRPHGSSRGPCRRNRSTFWARTASAG